MRQEPKYSNNDCIINRVANNFNTSSDICFFYNPKFVVENTCEIQSGLTINSACVNIINKNEEIFYLDSYISDNNSISGGTTSFNYEIYKYNPILKQFNVTPLFVSKGVNKYDLDDLSGYTFNLDVNKLQPDSEYILKLNYNFHNCNYILNQLNSVVNTKYKSDFLYGVYDNKEDFYFILLTRPDKPNLVIDTKTELLPGSLFSESVIIENDQQTITLAENYSGVPIIILNGLTLTQDEDYFIENSVISFNDTLVNGDLINAIYTYNSNGGGINNETFFVNNVISGVTNSEGNNRVYYNTSEEKFEIFVKNSINDFSGVILTLNGVTLANGIDYLQSVSNPLKIIFNGSLYDNDLINVYYASFNNFDGNLNSSNLKLYWDIENPISNENGEFSVVVSKDDKFTDIYETIVVPYEEYESNYMADIYLPGSFGEQYYIKVVNLKKYINIKNDELIIMNNSDTLNIKLSSNNDNSY